MSEKSDEHQQEPAGVEIGGKSKKNLKTQGIIERTKIDSAGRLYNFNNKRERIQTSEIANLFLERWSMIQNEKWEYEINHIFGRIAGGTITMTSI